MASERAARPAVYLASPMGFSAMGREYQARTVIPALEARGFHVLDPWHDEGGDTVERLERARRRSYQEGRLDELARINREIGERNVRLIEDSDFVLALLDGPDVDSGTAAEIGYAARAGRPVVGWRSDLRLSGENEAARVNLQVAHLILRGGGQIASSLDEALEVLERFALERRPA